MISGGTEKAKTTYKGCLANSGEGFIFKSRFNPVKSLTMRMGILILFVHVSLFFSLSSFLYCIYAPLHSHIKAHHVLTLIYKAVYSSLSLFLFAPLYLLFLLVLTNKLLTMITIAEDNPTPGQPAPSPVGFDNVPSHETPIDLKVQGSIPSWVQGVLYRSGKNKNATSVHLLTWFSLFLRFWKVQHLT